MAFRRLLLGLLTLRFGLLTSITIARRGMTFSWLRFFGLRGTLAAHSPSAILTSTLIGCKKMKHNSRLLVEVDAQIAIDGDS